MILTLLLLQGPIQAPEEPTTSLFPRGGEKTIEIGGRLQMDFGFPSGDSDMSAGSEMRRGRIRVFGDLATDVAYKMEFDFAGGDADVKDAYLQFKNLGPGKLTVGHQYEPLGLETMTSSRFITFLERSSLSEVLTPSRNMGIQYGSGNDQFTWAGGWYRETDDASETQDESTAFTGRFVYRPWFEDNGASLLHLGVGASVRDVDEMGAGVRFRQRPEYHMGDRLVDTGALMADGVTLIDLEGAWQEGPLHAQIEYSQAEVSGAGDPSFSGWSAQFGWFVTGEHRGYKASSGTWDRVKPASNAMDGGIGAWEVAARMSRLDLTEAAAVADEMDTITLAVNWYLNPYTRVMLNYIMSEVGAVQDDIIALRFGIDW